MKPSPQTVEEPESPEILAARSRRQLRMLLIATGLLLVPQLGELLAIRDINKSGQVSTLAFLFQFAGIFFIPTSIILTAAIVWAVHKRWRSHEKLLILAGINTLISLNLTWYTVNACSWSHVFGLTIRGCH